MAENRRLRKETRGLRSRAWWVLRKNKQMTLVDIQLSICDGTEGNPVKNLRKWLNELVKAKIMQRKRVDDGILTSNGSYCYTLVNDLGPKPPVVRLRQQHVYDPNSKSIFPMNSERQENVKEVIND